VWSPDGHQLLLNVSKDDRALLDVVLLALGTGKTTTKFSTGCRSMGGRPTYAGTAVTGRRNPRRRQNSLAVNDRADPLNLSGIVHHWSTNSHRRAQLHRVS
jgi:hypothetical protein